MCRGFLGRPILFASPHPLGLDAAPVRIAIAGTYRSGTTIIGEVLSAVPGTLVLTEPFSKYIGLEDVDVAFPYADGPDPRFGDLIDGFIAGTRRARFRVGVTPLRRLAHHFRPKSIVRRYPAALRAPPAQLILKDPFLALAGRHLIERHGFGMIYTIKHPCAFYRSILRLGWLDSPVEDLVAQGLVSADEAARATSVAASAALIWRTVYAHVLTVLDACPDRAALVRHEDFCRHPVEQVEAAARITGFPFTEAVRTAIGRSVSGKVVIPDDQSHLLVRNAAALPDAWRGKLSIDEERDIRDRCEPVYASLYDRPW